jgi:hypothetical protein
MTYTIPPGVTSTSAELNYVDLSCAAGTAEASKAMVLDASGDITSATQMTIANTSNAANSIYLHANGGTTETILLHADQGTGADSVKLLSDVGGLTFTHGTGDAITLGASSSSITHAAGADAADLTISQTGAFDASLILSSTGTGTDAIDINATAGGITADASGALSLQAGAASDLTTSAGAITVAGAGGVDVQYGSTSQANFSADGTCTLKANTAYTITHAADGAGEDLTISQTGAQNASLVLASAGTGTDAIDINATAGGITADATGSVAITSTNNAADSIYLHANGGASETIQIRSDQGTGADSIELVSDVGGLTLTHGVGDAITLGASSSSITHAAAADNADLTISQTGAFDASLVLSSTGTNTDAIDINATAGGIDVDANGALALNAGAASNLTTSSGAITVAGAGGVDVQHGSTSQANFSADGTLTLKSGGAYTISHAATADSQYLTLSQTGSYISGIRLSSAGTSADAIDIETSAGGVVVDSFGGVSVNGGGESNFSTSSGDLNLSGKTGLDLQFAGLSQANFSANGTLTLKANETYTITHAANGAGDDLTISQTGAQNASLLLSSAGTGSDAIGISATAGGVEVAGASGVDVQYGSTSQANFSADGTLTLKANEAYTITHAANNEGNDLTISQTGAQNASLVLTSAGTGTDAIDINATAGGIAADATGAISLEAGAASDFTTSGGAITFDGQTGVDVQFNGTSQANFSADGTCTLKANTAYTLTHAANGADDDLTISQTGAQDASLVLTSAGTGADAINIVSSAATSTSGIKIDSSGTGTAAIDINAASGGILVDAGGAISLDAGAASNLSTSGGAITFDGQTGVDVQFNGTSQANFSADGTCTLKANTAYTLTHAADGATEDLTISQTGAQDASLILSSAGTGTDAILLSASAGQITINGGAALVWPSSDGADNEVLTTNGSGVLSFEPIHQVYLYDTVENTDATLGVTHYYVTLNAATTAVTITLPAASALRRYNLKAIDITNTVTINRAGSDTIDGETSFVFTNQYESISIASDGTSKWYIY